MTKTFLIIFLFIFSIGYSQIKDIDGNIYKIIHVGDKVWFAENLRTTKYSDGSNIPYITENTNWDNASTPGFCWYNNDQSYKITYGGLYNWFAVDTKKLCPTGWRVPSNDDYYELVLTIDPNYTPNTGHLSMIAGGALKSTNYWASENIGATNELGFTGLPGGCRAWAGTFNSFEYFGYYWTSQMWSLALRWGTAKTFMNDSAEPQVGISVRCVKEYAGEEPTPTIIDHPFVSYK